MPTVRELKAFQVHSGLRLPSGSPAPQGGQGMGWSRGLEGMWEDPLTAAGKGRNLRGPTPFWQFLKHFPYFQLWVSLSPFRKKYLPSSSESLKGNVRQKNPVFIDIPLCRKRYPSLQKGSPSSTASYLPMMCSNHSSADIPLLFSLSLQA